MCKLKMEIKYRIVYLGSDHMLAWCEEHKGFIPAGLMLYVTTYDSLEEAMKAIRKVKRECSGWDDDIYIDSFSKYTYEEEEAK